MSGNFVQRGDFAVFNKHARARAAVLCGADLVVEIPSPYSTLSAEGFASAGVYILDSLGVCSFLSFGSESGDIGLLEEAAAAIESEEAKSYLKEWLGKGLPYASAQQRAADAVMGKRSGIFRHPNNLLATEYIKALNKASCVMRPVTVLRTGGIHDGGSGFSASALRKMLLVGESPWVFMPDEAAAVCKDEIAEGRGPVSMKMAELAILSRLRALKEAEDIQGASEGLDRRFIRYAASEPTIDLILSKTKTKRYVMSRLRRMLICACLGITAEVTEQPPPYIRVLAMNSRGMELLKQARKKTRLPVITKPASVHKLPEHAVRMFEIEATATDLYTLAYPDENKRAGGSEWRQTPFVAT